MDTQPIIKQDNQIKLQYPQSQIKQQDNQIKQQNDVKIQQEIKIDIQALLQLPQDIQQTQNNLKARQRITRWGTRKMKRSKIQQDAVFNPLQALYSGNSLLPITQYGQAQIQVKLSIYGDGRRRKSKWHHQIQKTFTPPMINYISPKLGLDQIQYLLRLYRLDELTAKINDFTPDDFDIKSPSPDPIYDKDGRRMNTYQVRKRDQLHRQRIGLIQDCIKMRPDFIPPDDYKPLKKFKKIYLTDSAMNDTKANYIGKIIGPEGKTQRLIQKRTNCKIGVRGRGTNKKGGPRDIFQNSQAPHILVVADNDDDLDKGVHQVHRILNGQEDDQIKQLLQSYNKIVVGILDDNYCDNCQIQGHRTWACPFANNNAAKNIKCQICNQSSHPTIDCPQRMAYLQRAQTQSINKLLQSQYSQFKSDLNSVQNKPKGTAFLTDEKKQLLSLTNGNGNASNNNQNNSSYHNYNQNMKNIQKTKQIKKKRLTNPQQIIFSNYRIPKFQDQ